MGSRLKFHCWSVVLVLALVLGETLVESQYYVAEESGEPPVIFVNSDSSALNPFGSPEQGRSFSVSQGNEDETAGRGFASRAGLARRMDSDEDEDEEERRPSPRKRRRNGSDNGRSRPINLPPGFDDRVRKRMKLDRRSKVPLHGDPNPIDEDDEDGRQPESRLLWPFSIEITKGAKDKGGWGHGGGGPGGYGSLHGHDHPPHKPGQFGHFGFVKSKLPPHHTRGGWGPQNGWGWDAFIEHEKHRLKYEILKLKAKKKIAVLQNKVELKKLFSMLLQKKIQALEWW